MKTNDVEFLQMLKAGRNNEQASAFLDGYKLGYESGGDQVFRQLQEYNAARRERITSRLKPSRIVNMRLKVQSHSAH